MQSNTINNPIKRCSGNWGKFARHFKNSIIIQNEHIDDMLLIDNNVQYYSSILESSIMSATILYTIIKIISKCKDDSTRNVLFLN